MRVLALSLTALLLCASTARADGPAAPTATAQPADGGRALRYVRSIGASLPAGLIVKERAEAHLLSEKDLAKLRRVSFPGKPAIAASCVDAASIAVSDAQDPQMPIAVIVALRFGDDGQAVAGAEALEKSSMQDYTDTFSAGPVVVVVTSTEPITGPRPARVSRLARELLASAKKDWDAAEKDSLEHLGK